MLGCGLRPNTSMHGVEERTEPPYLFKPERVLYTLFDSDGRKTQKLYRVHNFHNTIQRYDRLADIIDIPCGKVLNATAYRIDAEIMWQKAHEIYKQNPFFFTDTVK